MIRVIHRAQSLEDDFNQDINRDFEYNRYIKEVNNFALTTSKNPSCHKKLNRYCLNYQHKVRKWGKNSTM